MSLQKNNLKIVTIKIKLFQEKGLELLSVQSILETKWQHLATKTRKKSHLNICVKNVTINAIEKMILLNICQLINTMETKWKHLETKSRKKSHRFFTAYVVRDTRIGQEYGSIRKTALRVYMIR